MVFISYKGWVGWGLKCELWVCLRFFIDSSGLAGQQRPADLETKAGPAIGAGAGCQTTVPTIPGRQAGRRRVPAPVFQPLLTVQTRTRSIAQHKKPDDDHPYNTQAVVETNALSEPT